MKKNSQLGILKKLIANHKKMKTNWSWLIKIIILAFVISFTFSFVSELTLPKVNIYLGIVIVLLFIILGIMFDVIGVAVTAAEEAPFHSMNSRKIESAKTAIALKKNADKVSSFCNDVVGDICGIVSGSAGVAISSTISNSTGSSPLFTALIVTGLIASLTIGGKAFSKSAAINNADIILYEVSNFISIFKHEK